MILMLMANDVLKHYFLFQEEDELLIVVNSPAEYFDGDSIQSFWEEVRARELEELIDCDIEKVLLQAERGVVVRIGGKRKTAGEGGSNGKTDDEIAQRPAVSSPNQPFEIEIHRGNLSATIMVQAGTRSITREQIYSFLEGLGIVYGIKEENVEALVQKYPLVNNILIAEGTPASPGQDAKITLRKEIKTDHKPTSLDHGRVDFKLLNLISPIQADEIIQERTPPVQGEAGTDVFGKVIPGRDGKDKKLKKGKNTEIRDDGCSLVSLEEGFLFIGPTGAINVLPIYIVDGDVDYHTGTVEYKGDIVVKGDVRTGFNVNAGGDIQVMGTVEDSFLEAKGNIDINCGVRSSGGAILKAGGDVHVNFVENTHIEADGNIIINREAINSDITAGGDVEVVWNKGRIIGGSITAGGLVAAPTIGAPPGGHIEIVFEPEGWESCFKTINKIDHHLTKVSKDSNLTKEEKARKLNELVSKRIMETGGLDEIFSNSIATAKAFLPPIHLLFGQIAFRITTEIGPMTFSFGNIEITQEIKYIDAEQREKIRKQRESK